MLNEKTSSNLSNKDGDLDAIANIVKDMCQGKKEHLEKRRELKLEFQKE